MGEDEEFTEFCVSFPSVRGRLGLLLDCTSATPPFRVLRITNGGAASEIGPPCTSAVGAEIVEVDGIFVRYMQACKLVSLIRARAMSSRQVTIKFRRKKDPWANIVLLKDYAPRVSTGSSGSAPGSSRNSSNNKRKKPGDSSSSAAAAISDDSSAECPSTRQLQRRRLDDGCGVGDEAIAIMADKIWSSDAAEIESALRRLVALLPDDSGAAAEDLLRSWTTRGAYLAAYRAMVRFPNHARVHRAALDLARWMVRAIQAVAAARNGEGDRGYETAAEHVRAVLDLGIYDLCVRTMMVRFSSDRNLVRSGCILIESMIAVADDDVHESPASSGKKLLLERAILGGGLKALTTAMRKFPRDQLLVNISLSTLLRTAKADSICGGSLGYRALVDAGGIETAAKAMLEHGDSTDIQRLGCTLFCDLSAKAVQSAEGAAENGGSGKDLRKQILDAKGLEAVSAAYRLHQDDQEVSKLAAKALHELCPRP